MAGSDSRVFRERRQSPRLDVAERLDIRLVGGQPEVRPHNLSGGGFSVVSDQAFTVGAVHRFAITPRAGGAPTVLAARVVYSRRFAREDAPDQFFTGFAFLASGSRELQKVDQLLDSLTGTLSFD